MKGIVIIWMSPVVEFRNPACVIDRLSLRMISGSRVGKKAE